jgi:hypothetical protein
LDGCKLRVANLTAVMGRHRAEQFQGTGNATDWFSRDRHAPSLDYGPELNQ